MDITTGHSLSHDFEITPEQVRSFAEASGDFNPLHFDEEFCAGTRFKKPIVHGLLGASVFSKVYGNIFPGNGTVYVSQTLNFKKPIYPATKYTAHFEVIALDSAKSRLTVRCEVLDKDGVVCLSGESVLFNEEIFNQP